MSKLERVRSKQGLTRGELAKKAGVSEALIEGIETEKCKVVTAGAMLALAAALEQTAEEIFLPRRFSRVNEGGINMWEKELPERSWQPPEYGQESWPRCPVCGEETDTLYQNEDGEIVGCDGCIHYMDAWQWKELEEWYDSF